jgi:hypothetical protein
MPMAAMAAAKSFGFPQRPRHWGNKKGEAAPRLPEYLLPLQD